MMVAASGCNRSGPKACDSGVTVWRGSERGDPVVVRYAPQVELVKRAAAVITHAGLNTVLETLAEGVPLVALP